jgi:hypothetical protein
LAEDRLDQLNRPGTQGNRPTPGSLAGLFRLQQNQRTTESRRECSGVRVVCKAPADEFLLATSLPPPAPTYNAALSVEGFERIERGTKAAGRQSKFNDVVMVALIYARGDLAFAPSHRLIGSRTTPKAGLVPTSV